VAESASRPHALDGVRVLEMYGADVNEIERPPRGDLARRPGPFLYLNSGKRSATLDLRDAASSRSVRGEYAVALRQVRCV